MKKTRRRPVTTSRRKSRPGRSSHSHKSTKAPRRRVFSTDKRKVRVIKKRKKEKDPFKRKKRGKPKKATPGQKKRKGIEFHPPRLKKGVRAGRRTVCGLLFRITAIGRRGGYEGAVIQPLLYRYFRTKGGKEICLTPAQARERAIAWKKRLRRQYKGALKIIRIDVSFLTRKGYAARKRK